MFSRGKMSRAVKSRRAERLGLVSYRICRRKTYRIFHVLHRRPTGKDFHALTQFYFIYEDVTRPEKAARI